VENVKPMHVPERHLAKYRRLRELSFLMNRMGGMVSNLGMYEDANKLWGLAGKYKRLANELRVDGTDGQEVPDRSSDPIP
jgi:hypothetical protein